MRPAPLLLLALALGLTACSRDAAPSVNPDAPASVAGSMRDDEPDNHAVTPPEAVGRAFAAAYPSVTDVMWEREGDGYEAGFRLDGTDTSVVYAADGTPGLVETEIAVGDLPAGVAAALARDHAGQRVTEAARQTEHGQTRYEAEVTVDGVATDLVFMEDGTLVERSSAEGD